MGGGHLKHILFIARDIALEEKKKQVGLEHVKIALNYIEFINLDAKEFIIFILSQNYHNIKS